VPVALKIFLMALAIIDDLGAIVIIALFYTSDLSILSLSVAAGAIAVLALLNIFNVRRIGIYILVGMVLWTAVLKSGVHATLAGVIVGFFVPLKPQDGKSPAKQLEHAAPVGRLYDPAAVCVCQRGRFRRRDAGRADVRAAAGHCRAVYR
jgi:NhaA family Na+:H+ antiporter